MAGHERYLGVTRRLDKATGDGPAGRRRATSEARAEAVCVTRCLTAAYSTLLLYLAHNQPTATLRCRDTRWRFTVQCSRRRVSGD